MHKTPPVTIHKAITEDAGAMAKLAKELADYEGEATRCDAQAMADCLSQEHVPQMHACVAKTDGGDIVGFVMGYVGYDLSSNSRGLHLNDIVVTTAHRRQGIGQALMAHLVEEVLDNKGEWISLTVLKHNQAAQAFYRTLGFTCVDVDFYAAGKDCLHKIREK